MRRVVGWACFIVPTRFHLLWKVMFFSGFCCLTFATEFVFGIAGLAPLANYFSFYSKRKVTRLILPGAKLNSCFIAGL